MFMPNPGKTRRPSSELTRTALIEAGLNLFGKHGFDATSTRDLAAAANTNIASIAYHFGGKEGLLQACAQAVVDRIKDVAGRTLLASPPAKDADEAAAMLETVFSTVIRFIVSNPDAQNIANFILREITDSKEIVEHVYAELFGPLHIKLCQLWGTATGSDPESPRTRLAVFSAIGQMIYFRVGRPMVLKRMDWSDIGAEEADQIIATILANLRAMIAAAREGAP